MRAKDSVPGLSPRRLPSDQNAPQIPKRYHGAEATLSAVSHYALEFGCRHAPKLDDAVACPPFGQHRACRFTVYVTKNGKLVRAREIS